MKMLLNHFFFEAVISLRTIYVIFRKALISSCSSTVISFFFFKKKSGIKILSCIADDLTNLHETDTMSTQTQNNNPWTTLNVVPCGVWTHDI